MKSFRNESLIDYMEASGKKAPDSLLRGESPTIKLGSHGKPYFCEEGFEGIFFSLSHTKGHAILCFCEKEIGVDCENTKARFGGPLKYTNIADRYFTENERAYVVSKKEDIISRFFEIWTAKEAYMKYTGNGFSEGFLSFSVFDLPDMRFMTGRIEDAPEVVYSVCKAA